MFNNMHGILKFGFGNFKKILIFIGFFKLIFFYWRVLIIIGIINILPIKSTSNIFFFNFIFLKYTECWKHKLK